MNSIAQSDFLAAMLKLYKEGEAIDANVVCQGIKKPVHSAVLVARFLIVVFVRFQDMPPVSKRPIQTMPLFLIHSIHYP